MATIKSYTDLEQSKKLAEILPLDSADMFFQLGEDKFADSIRVPLTKKHWEQMIPDINPCWSLASLLSILPKGTRLLKSATDDAYHCDCPKGNIDKWFDNAIDAAFEMVCWLKENNKI